MRKVLAVTAAALAASVAAGAATGPVRVGDTPKQVRAKLGTRFTICTAANSPTLCKDPVWLYQYTRGKPLGLAVRFHRGRVSAVFRLGAVTGWKSGQHPGPPPQLSLKA